MGGYFIENRGQVNGLVRYYSTGNPSVAFRDDGVVFVVSENREKGDMAGEWPHFPWQSAPAVGHVEPANSFAYLIRFDGANLVTPVGRDRLPFNSNFFIGKNSSGRIVDVPNYREVVYENLYDGIDLVYRPQGSAVKYEFTVDTMSDPGLIEVVYEGVKPLLEEGGGVVIKTVTGAVRDSRPFSYQAHGKEVDCDFVPRSPLSYGFDCEAWDASTPLTIDPLVYSTYLGGSDLDSVASLAIDSSGNAYATGATTSVDFPSTPGSFDSSANGWLDVFVAKLDPTGGSLVYSTYLGGIWRDEARSISIDPAGNAFVIGDSQSNDFPVTVGAFDTTLNGSTDAFVLKLNATGSGLIYSTYIGGEKSDWALSGVVDSSDNVYLTGYTFSADFPATPGAYDVTYNGTFNKEDIFVTKLGSDGSSLVYSTFIGTSDEDRAWSIAVSSAGEAYVCGETTSPDYPTTPGAYDGSFNGWLTDAVLTALTATGNGLLYSTYLGGSDADGGFSVAVDSMGNAFVAGLTRSTDFPTTAGAFDETFNGGTVDTFVTKVSPGGGSLAYSAFIGGSGSDYGGLLSLDPSGSVYITGYTDSTDFPLSPDAFDATLGANDTFVTRLDPTASSIIYSTFLGGSLYEQGNSIVVDLSGNIYVAGYTNSSDFPTTAGAYDGSLGGTYDGFVTKIASTSPDLAIAPSDIGFAPPGPVVSGKMVTINATLHDFGGKDANNIVVRFHDGMPNPSNQIGSDGLIPFIAGSGGTGLASLSWIAWPPGIHAICVVADPEDAIPEGNEGNNVACRSIDVGVSYALIPGQRFMSFPLMPPDDRIETALASIVGCYDYVRWYDVLDSEDHWKSYVPGRGYNDLERLDNTRGFWINLTAVCNFTMLGIWSPPTVITFHQGWNMVGFPSFNTSYSVADLKANLGLVSILVEAFDAGAAPYYLQRVPDSYVMKAGEGYWIYVPSDTTWIVNR